MYMLIPVVLTSQVDCCGLDMGQNKNKKHLRAVPKQKQLVEDADAIVTQIPLLHHTDCLFSCQK